MQRISEFPISIFDSMIVLPLIQLIFIKVEPISIVFVLLQMTYEDTFDFKNLAILCYKFELFSLEIWGFSWTEKEFIFMPIVWYKLLVL